MDRRRLVIALVIVIVVGIAVLGSGNYVKVDCSGKKNFKDFFLSPMSVPLVLECKDPSNFENIRVDGHAVSSKTHTEHHPMYADKVQIELEIGKKCDELIKSVEDECIGKLRSVALGGREFKCGTCPKDYVGGCSPKTYIHDVYGTGLDLYSNCQAVTWVTQYNDLGKPMLRSTSFTAFASCGGNGLLTLECVWGCRRSLDGGGSTEGGGKV